MPDDADADENPMPDDSDILELASLVSTAVKRANARALERRAALETRLWSLPPGKAMIFRPLPDESVRGLKIRLTHAIKAMQRQSEIRVLDGKLADGSTVTYARLRAGLPRLTPPGADAPSIAPAKRGRPRKS